MTRTPNSIKRIHESINNAFNNHRIVFWYDSESEWTEEFDSYKESNITKYSIDRNEFSVKVKISRASSDQKYLLYFRSPKPTDENNWLLDVLLAGYEFKADPASIYIQMAGLPLEFKGLAQKHKSFFRAPSRCKKLKDLFHPNDDEKAICLKMLAVITNQSPSIDHLLLHAFSIYDPTDSNSSDQIDELFGTFGLKEFFWEAVSNKFGYQNNDPCLSDFAVQLFNTVSCLGNNGHLESHAQVFLSDWKDSRQNDNSFIKWSKFLSELLKIEHNLLDQKDEFNPHEDDCYELIELFCIRRLIQQFSNLNDSSELLERINLRKNSFWYEKHSHAYDAIRLAVELRNLIIENDLKVQSFENGLQKYCNNWWRIDRTYRCCVFHTRSYGQPGLMKPLKEWVENQYLNNALRPLTNQWSDHVKDLSHWSSVNLHSQKSFHKTYIHTPLSSSKLKRLFVVISDALRYEAAHDFVDRLNSQSNKSWDAKINALLGVLPSYTQLGMASLLPGNKININISDPNAPATVDGKSVSGTENRDKFFKEYHKGRSKAIQSEEFLNLSTTKEAAQIILDNDLIVVYHNRIDRISDKLESEADTCEAVEDSFEDLQKILKKISSLKGSQVIITADHGFLFQQEPVYENDRSNFPAADDMSIKKRRFAMGNNIKAESGVKIFSANQLGLEGEWDAAFPLGLNRFPKSGSGNRFVHGGTSLQEIVIPVIRLKKIVKVEIQQVKAELLRVPVKITTPRIKFFLFQDEPCKKESRLPLKLRISVIAKKDNALLSVPKIVSLESEAIEPREREQEIEINLTNTAGGYNNEILELKFEQLKEGIQTPVPYQTREIKLLQPFGNDFEDL